jgi:6-phosphofructokinase 1
MALQAASNGEFGCMVSLRGRDVVTVPLKDAIARQRLVPLDSQLITTARAVGVCLGD